MQEGSRRLAEEAQRFTSLLPADAGYLVLDLDGARALGIRPIPFAAGQGRPAPLPGAADGPAKPKLIRLR